MVVREGFEPSKAEPSDLQSDPFGHSGTSPQYMFFIKYMFKKNGAAYRIRTNHLLITSQLLYQMS